MSTRNMINANMNVFSILKEFISQSKESSPYPSDAKRYIKTDKIEKEWLQKLEIIKTHLLPSLIFSTIKFENKDYFAVIGWESSVEFENIFKLIDINGGIFTALVSELKVPIKNDANLYEIIDEVLYSYEEDSSYKGHDFKQLIKFFKPILLYEITDDSPLKADNIYRFFNTFCGRTESPESRYRDCSVSGIITHCSDRAIPFMADTLYRVFGIS